MLLLPVEEEEESAAVGEGPGGGESGRRGGRRAGRGCTISVVGCIKTRGVRESKTMEGKKVPRGGL